MLKWFFINQEIFFLKNHFLQKYFHKYDPTLIQLVHMYSRDLITIVQNINIELMIGFYVNLWEISLEPPIRKWNVMNFLEGKYIKYHFL